MRFETVVVCKHIPFWGRMVIAYINALYRIPSWVEQATAFCVLIKHVKVIRNP